MQTIRTILKGRKTYVVAVLMVLVSAVNYLTGDISFIDFITSTDVQLLLEGLGLGALRAGIAKL